MQPSKKPQSKYKKFLKKVLKGFLITIASLTIVWLILWYFVFPEDFRRVGIFNTKVRLAISTLGYKDNKTVVEFKATKDEKYRINVSISNIYFHQKNETQKEYEPYLNTAYITNLKDTNFDNKTYEKEKYEEFISKNDLDFKIPIRLIIHKIEDDKRVLISDKIYQMEYIEREKYLFFYSIEAVKELKKGRYVLSIETPIDIDFLKDRASSVYIGIYAVKA